jgi:hypothetical protein
MRWAPAFLQVAAAFAQITPAKSALSLATADVDGSVSVVLRPSAELPVEENRQQISSTDPNKPLARNR